LTTSWKMTKKHPKNFFIKKLFFVLLMIRSKLFVKIRNGKVGGLAFLLQATFSYLGWFRFALHNMDILQRGLDSLIGNWNQSIILIVIFIDYTLLFG
jgi:membrane protein insertase Oxa1/YidC/SpoIIIJ